MSVTTSGNDLTAFGRLDFGFKDAAEDDENGSNLEEAFVGLKYGVASLAFGKQNFATDEFGIEEAIEVETIDEDRFDGLATDGDDTIRVDVELDKVYFAASHEMDANDDGDGIDGEFYDLFVGTELAGLELAAAYQQYRPANGLLASGTGMMDDSVGTWGASIGYDFKVVYLAADYSVSDWSFYEDANGDDVWADEDMTQYNLAAVFPVASTTDVALGMGNKDSDAWDEDITEWYANVTYKFPAHKNVSVFAEVAQSDEEYDDGEDAELGFLAGMRVKF